MVFAEDPEQWAMPLTRWVSGSRPDQEGRFKVQNLPPGSYYAIAVDYLPQGEWSDPELLERLKTRAKRFTLGRGSTKTLDLKLTERLTEGAALLSPQQLPPRESASSTRHRALPARVEVGDQEDHDDQAEREPLVRSRGGPAQRVQVLDQQLRGRPTR